MRGTGFDYIFICNILGVLETNFIKQNNIQPPLKTQTRLSPPPPINFFLRSYGNVHVWGSKKVYES